MSTPFLSIQLLFEFVISLCVFALTRTILPYAHVLRPQDIFVYLLLPIVSYDCLIEKTLNKKKSTNRNILLDFDSYIQNQEKIIAIYAPIILFLFGKRTYSMNNLMSSWSIGY